ncbi:MAG: PQQ-dependent sugar dehydrogenase [Aquaticitalea sp.]
MRKFTLIIMCFICVVSFAQQVDIQSFATGFNNPVNIANAGDSRLFIVEQAGRIKILNSDGTVNSELFLDIVSDVTSGGERGLLGLAFHPNYDTNGYFYVYYSSETNSVISRFSRSSTNPDVADQTSELQLLTFSQPFNNHNGGDMAFGSDGYLYIASGDGGSANDPQNNAQSLNTLLGKLLRIDVDGTSNGNYGIPADNPYAESATNMEEIWAYGLRNPWKFSFDKDTGDLWIGDVGQNVREEINMVSSTAAGLNYGWKCFEGNASYITTDGCPPTDTLTFPIAQYTHNGSGEFKCSITGGYRYRGTDFSNFSGIYFFADYCSNEIGMLSQSGDSWDMSFSQVYGGNGWTTFGEDFNGELYIAGINSGIVYKLVDPTLTVAEMENSAIKLFPNPAHDAITLDLSDSSMVIEYVAIYNIQGKILISHSDLGHGSLTISTKDLEMGVYFVEITNSHNQRTIKKLIKN